MSESLITEELVSLDQPLGATKEEVITSVAGIVAAAGRAEQAGLARDALAREAKSPTGMPGGFAIPHCRSEAVSTGSLGFARLPEPVDFGAKDGPSDLVIMIAASADGGADHMKLLTKLARALVKKDFLAALRAAATPAEVVALVRGVVEPPAADAAAPAAATASAPAAGATAAAPATTAAPAAAAPAPASGTKRIVAVTACPTGIAHTYMAADYLTQAGQEMGIQVDVEPQGSASTEKLSPETIAAADAVIFATDVGVKGKERFAGLPVIESGVKRAVNEPKKMLEEAVAASENPNARKVSGDASAAATGDEGSSLSLGKRVQQALMTGVSYMIPFVAAGGLLIALGFLFGGYDVTANAATIVKDNSFAHLPAGWPHALLHSGFFTYIGAVCFMLGSLGFGFLVPALAGYIAFGIADRPGIAPGFITGAVAVAVGAGFIGGLVGGLIAGAIALAIQKLEVPRWLRGLMPVVIIPLATTLIAGGLMYVVLGKPLSILLRMMQNGLSGMSGSYALLLGAIVGAMMCVDLGGPVNKAAYLFATTGLSVADPASMKIMAAVMAGGMVPPLALALATALRPKLFTKIEQENGRAAWLLGASFISEGAIPFAAADPLRIIPSMIAGGAVTGALSMAFDAQSKAPHGGVFVAFAIHNFLLWVLAIVIGMVISAFLTVLLKTAWKKKDDTLAPATTV